MSYVCEEIIRALSDELSKDNNNLLVMSMASSVKSFDALARAIREKDIDGLFILGDFCKEIVNMISEQVPEKLSIISFDDTPLTFLTIPTLTSVSYNKSELALLAVKYLYGDMQKINSRILVPVKLMVRESTSKIGEAL